MIVGSAALSAISAAFEMAYMIAFEMAYMIAQAARRQPRRPVWSALPRSSNPHPRRAHMKEHGMVGASMS